MLISMLDCTSIFSVRADRDFPLDLKTRRILQKPGGSQSSLVLSGQHASSSLSRLVDFANVIAATMYVQ